ncbi:MAG TPA: hypothetical protein VFB41_04620 [Solirubrobacteraceae bacterium]|nr:hypothetical protein [Solirubrobacteraceae bacterium]
MALTGLGLVMGAVVAVSAAPEFGPDAASAAAAPGVKLTLVDVSATNTYSPQNWTVNTATRTAVGTFTYGTGTYVYTMPSVIPAGGAAAKLTMTIQNAQNWATGFSVSGNADFSPEAAVQDYSVNRGPNYTAVREFTITPRTYPAGTSFVDLTGHAYFSEGPTFTFRYRVDTEPVTPPPSTSITNSNVTPAQVFTLPSNRRCVSRRNFTIRLKRPGKVSYLAAKVTVNGRQAPVFVLNERYLTIRGDVLTRRRLSARVDLRGLPKGQFRVGITAVTKSLRSIRGARLYRTCEPKRS